MINSIHIYLISFVLLTILSKFGSLASKDLTSEFHDKEYGVRYATPCEVCKYVSAELQERFDKLGQTSQVIETGYRLDGEKKRVQYTRSELYYIESLEGICDELLQYKIHKERKDSNRFAKDKSMTFRTLDKLVNRGVKVDLGIPHELWDSPSAEITALKQQCEDNVEKYEDIIEQWYWGDRKQPLHQYLCRDRVLKKEQSACLDDPPPPPPEAEPENESEEVNEASGQNTQDNKDEL